VTEAVGIAGSADEARPCLHAFVLIALAVLDKHRRDE
jgi:hypothetical protein